VPLVGGCGEQVTGAFTADAVVAVTEAGEVGGVVGQVGQLVKDDLGTKRGQGLHKGIKVKDVADDGLGAKLAQQAGLVG
jgi:hypothetical protein